MSVEQKQFETFIPDNHRLSQDNIDSSSNSGSASEQQQQQQSKNSKIVEQQQDDDRDDGENVSSRRDLQQEQDRDDLLDELPQPQRTQTQIQSQSQQPRAAEGCWPIHENPNSPSTTLKNCIPLRNPTLNRGPQLGSRHALSRASSTLSVASSVHDYCPYGVGERVYVDGQRAGLIKYVGETEFGGVGLWVGIELDSELGKNDGSVDGVRYFECTKPAHGIFVRPVRLQAQPLQHSELTNMSNSSSGSGSGSNSHNTNEGGASGRSTGPAMVRQGSSKNLLSRLASFNSGNGTNNGQHQVQSASGAVQPATGALRRARSSLQQDNNNSSSSSIVRPKVNTFRVPQTTIASSSNNRLRYTSSQGKSSKQTAASSSTSGVSSSFLSSSSASGCGQSSSSAASSSSACIGSGGLRVGQRVLVNSSSGGLKTGTLRFVGPTEFASSGDIYAGVELDEPTGKNDGTVAGKLYFTCRPQYGLFAPLAKVQRLTAALERQLEQQQQRVVGNESTVNECESTINKLATNQHRASPAFVRRSVSSLGSSSAVSSRHGSHESLPYATKNSNNKTFAHTSLWKPAQQHTSLIVAHTNLLVTPAPHDNMANQTINKDNNSQLLALQDKDQQIELLQRERNEQQRDNHELMQRLQELEQRLMQSELEKSRMSSEADEEIVELKRLSQELEDENRKLQEKYEHEHSVHEEAQFRVDELETQRSEYEQQFRELEQLRQQLQQQQQSTTDSQASLATTTTSSASKLERSATTKAKYEKELATLKEQVICRDEQLMQLRTSLEMRKNEVKQLQNRVADFERTCKLESERNERHLAKIDDINLELKASEAKLAAKSEEAEMLEKQVRQLRHDLRLAEQQIEQMSLVAKKKSAGNVRRGATPTSPTSLHQSGSAGGTPTVHDELVRYQIELRDVKDELIDREAECDCLRREMDLLKHKLETRSLEVDTNNQELARRCQDLLESARQSDDTIKQLMKSNAEYSHQLIRASQDLKDANGKCQKLRDEITDLERQLADQQARHSQLTKQNCELRADNDDLRDQVDALRRDMDASAKQLDELREQLHVAQAHMSDTNDKFVTRLSDAEKDNTQLRHDAATLKHDVRSMKQQVQELQAERDRYKQELSVRDQYVESRDSMIATLKQELEVARATCNELKAKLNAHAREINTQAATSGATGATDGQQLAAAVDKRTREARAQVDALRHELEQLETQNETLKTQLEQNERACQQHLESRATVDDECRRVRAAHEQLQTDMEAKAKQIAQLESELETQTLAVHDKYREERNELLNKIGELERQLADEQQRITQHVESHVNTGQNGTQVSAKFTTASTTSPATPTATTNGTHTNLIDSNEREEFESQIEFLNSIIVDMQKECDELKTRCNTLEDVATLKRSSLKSTTHNNNNHKPVPGKAVRVRLYCDICECFDAHQTDNCPKKEPAATGVRFGDTESAAAFAQKLSLDDDALLDYYKEPTSNRYFQSLRRRP